MLEFGIPDPKPKDNPKAAEIKKSFFEAISRATKYLISSTFILLILIAVVGQELREFRGRQATLVSQIQGAATSERLQRRKLGKQAASINESLSSKFDDRTPSAGSARPSNLPQANGVLVQNQIELQANDEKKPLSEILGLHPSEIPQGDKAVHRTDEIDALVRGDQKLGELVRLVKDQVERNKAASPGQSEKAWLNTARDLVRDLERYRGLYQEHTDLGRALLSVTKESVDLKAAKKSIPTPFGSFQIAPKLALFGLAVALLLTYFPFYSSVRRIRRLANEHNAATGRDGVPPLRIPAPFWSPDHERQHDLEPPVSLSSFPEILLSVSLHLIWLFAAGWLIYECLFTWNVTKALAFEFKNFWEFLLVATLAGAVLAAVWLYFLERWKSALPKLKGSDGKESANLKRRAFVSLGVLSVVGLLGFGLFRFGRKQKGPRAVRKKASDFVATSEDWVQNKGRRKTVHNIRSCGSHLPKRINQEPVNFENLAVHAGCAVRILDDLGAEANLQMIARRRRQAGPTRIGLDSGQVDHGKRSEGYYLKAIELSPLSMHLYDRLAKVYGTLEYYDKIQPLYLTGLGKVRGQVAELDKAKTSTGKQRRLRLLRRTELTLNDRISRVQARKAAADKWKASHPNKALDSGRKT